jgi:hypothetical protein
LDRADHGLPELTLRNTGSSAIVVNLGVMLDNGRVLVPQQIRLIASSASGKTRQFVWKSAGVGGRVDDFLVPLMLAAKYTMTLSVDDFFDAVGNTTIVAGDKIHAVYDGVAPANASGPASPNLPIWNHRVETTPRIYGE